jgi:hypothetical protein
MYGSTSYLDLSNSSQAIKRVGATPPNGADQRLPFGEVSDRQTTARDRAGRSRMLRQTLDRAGSAEVYLDNATVLDLVVCSVHVFRALNNACSHAEHLAFRGDG